MSASAIGDASYVNVTPVKQKEYNWCWAACSEMCGKTIDTTSTKTQVDVVRYLKETDGPAFGNGADVMNGCQYVANFKRTFSAKKIDFDTLVQKAKKKEATVALGKDINNPDGEGHCLLINGTIFYDGDGGSQYEVYYIDPETALSYRCDYDEFCDGSYNKRWTVRTIVYAV